MELTEYVLENYDFNYILKSDIDPKYDEDVVEIIDYTFYSSNFIFLETILLPFLRKNPLFVKRNIRNIIIKTFFDFSGFFTTEFLKYPEINYENVDGRSFLVIAIHERNSNSVEALLKNPNVDITSLLHGSFTAFQVACGIQSDLKIIKLFLKHPKFDMKYEMSLSIPLIDILTSKNNFLALEYLSENCPDFKPKINLDSFYVFYSEQNIYTLKVLLKLYLKLNEDKSFNDVINCFKRSVQNDTMDNFIDQLNKIYLEIMNKNSGG